MKTETVDKYYNDWLKKTKGKSDPEVQAETRLLIKIVERDTRHAACDEVAKASHKMTLDEESKYRMTRLQAAIHNLDH